MSNSSIKALASTSACISAKKLDLLRVPATLLIKQLQRLCNCFYFFMFIQSAKIRYLCMTPLYRYGSK